MELEILSISFTTAVSNIALLDGWLPKAEGLEIINILHFQGKVLIMLDN